LPKQFVAPTSFDNARARLLEQSRRIRELEGEMSLYKNDTSIDSIFVEVPNADAGLSLRDRYIDEGREARLHLGPVLRVRRKSPTSDELVTELHADFTGAVEIEVNSEDDAIDVQRRLRSEGYPNPRLQATQRMYRKKRAAIGNAQSERLFLEDWIGQRSEPNDRALLPYSGCIDCRTPLPQQYRDTIYTDGWIKVRMETRGELYTVWFCSTCSTAIANKVDVYLREQHADSIQHGSDSGGIQHRQPEAAQRTEHAGAGRQPAATSHRRGDSHGSRDDPPGRQRGRL
jgi:hypothetical protein